MFYFLSSGDFKRSFKKGFLGAGEMIWWIRVLVPLQEVLSSQQPHSDLQPSIVGFNVLFWHYTDLSYIKYQ